MKTYRELYFKGNTQQLSKFVDKIGQYAVGDWKLLNMSNQFK